MSRGDAGEQLCHHLDEIATAPAGGRVFVPSPGIHSSIFRLHGLEGQIAFYNSSYYLNYKFTESFCPSVCLSACLCLSVCLSVYLSISTLYDLRSVCPSAFSPLLHSVTTVKLSYILFQTVGKCVGKLTAIVRAAHIISSSFFFFSQEAQLGYLIHPP